jgi:CDP-4-dehydro-6-deoxyglucose reductase
MEYRVTLHPSGNVFLAHQNETILEAGLREGHNLNYQCDNGSCGICKARLLCGEINKIKPGEFVITDAEKEQGYFLPCAHEAVSNLEIEAGESSRVSDMPYQEIPARTKKIELVSEDIIILQLRTPRTRTLRFLAGQNVTLELPDKSERVLQVASCPCNGMVLEFHVRNQKDDRFDQYLFECLLINDEVIVKGPSGEFVLDEESTRPLIFIAYDTGFAGIKSLMEHVIALELEQDVYLYRVLCNPADNYLYNVCRSWSDAIDNFHYHSFEQCLPAGCDDEMQGNMYDKLVDAIQHEYPSQLSSSDIYLSGPESMVVNLGDRLVKKGFPQEQLKIQGLA